MRVLTVFLAVILAILGCFLAARSNTEAYRAKEALHKERYTRMVAEENLEDARAKIVSLEAEFGRLQKKAEGIEKRLEHTLALNEDLKSKLNRASKTKEELESKVKNLRPVSANYKSGDTIEMPEIPL